MCVNLTILQICIGNVVIYIIFNVQIKYISQIGDTTKTTQPSPDIGFAANLDI